MQQNVFDQKAKEYDRWFDEHPVWFQSEINALAKAIPEKGVGLSIGVGTGRFAEKFSIPHGLDPSKEMLRIAKKRGVQTYIGKAEDMPFDAGTFDYALMVTTLCFLDDISKAFYETRRILKSKGIFLIGMIDKNSPLGREYQDKKKENPFYRHAHFHSVPEVTDLLKKNGFGKFEHWQTLITASEEKPEAPKRGYGRGGFVVIKATIDQA